MLNKINTMGYLQPAREMIKLAPGGSILDKGVSLAL